MRRSTLMWGICSAMLVSVFVVAQEPVVDTAPAVKALDGAIKNLKAERDRLADALNNRIKSDAKKDDTRDVLMRLAEGADQEEADFILRQRGGEMAESYAVVPVWSQEDFMEIFKWFHRGRNDAVTRNIFRNGLDVGTFSLKDDVLSSDLTATYLLDKRKDELFPPGTQRRWKTGQVWTALELMAMVNHEKKQVQTYHVEAKMLEGVYDFELRLPNAILKKKDLVVKFQVPAQPWVRGEAWATDWNCGYHSLDASALTYENGVLEGPLMVALNPDAWYPKRPQYMVYNIKAKVDGRKCIGTFEGEGDMEGGAGPVSGEAGPFFAGTYSASGDFGDYDALVFGRTMPVREDVSELLTGDMEEPEGVSPVQARARYASKLYDEIRALRLASDQYPLPIERALATTANPAPVWEEMNAEAVASAVAFAEQVQERLKVADKVKLDDVVMGSPELADETFGPFGMITALESPATNVYALPAVKTAGPQQWAYVPVWQVIKAIEQVDTLDNNTEKVPEIVPVDGISIEADMRKYRFGKGEKIPDRVLETWQAVAAPYGKAEVGYTSGGSIGSVSYFKTTLRSEAAQDVWVSMRAKNQGKLWVNGKLAWVGEELKHRSQDDLQAVFKISLEKGDNELLVRVREHRKETILRAHVCLQGAPREGSKSEVVEVPASDKIATVMGTCDGYFPNAGDVPLAWDADKGVNVAYETKLPGPALSAPVASDGRLYVACQVGEEPKLVCLDQKTGKVLWQQGGWLPEGKYEGVSADIIANGEMVFIKFAGMVTAYDQGGSRKWQLSSEVAGDSFHVGIAGDAVIVEGFPLNATLRRSEHLCAAYNVADGTEIWKVTVPGEKPLSDKPLPRLLRLRNGETIRDVVVLGSLQLVDPKTGELLCDAPVTDAIPGSPVYLHGDTLVYGVRWKGVTVRYMLDPDGQVLARELWNVSAEGKANDRRGMLVAGRYVALSGTVAEDTKGHSPAPYRQIEFYDRETGRPIKRIKQAASQAGLFGYEPVYVNGYVGIYVGAGGSDGNASDYGQLVWVRMGDDPVVAVRNRLPVGETMYRGQPAVAGPSRPVFEGGRMFVVAGETMWSFARSKEGARYEQEMLAEQMFENLWDIPKDERYARPAPFEKAPAFGTVPISLFENNVGLANWMVAAPFPIPEAKDVEEEEIGADLAALRPMPGDKLEQDGVVRTFEPLPQEAVNCKYSYGGEYYLCGMGGTVARVQKLVDVLSCTDGKKDMCGILYTVVQSTRPRVATLMVPMDGVEVWMGGIRLKPYQTVELDAGTYPLMARLRPDRMGEKPGEIEIAFLEIRDPRSARQTWLRKVLKAEDEIKGVATQLSGTVLGDKAERYLVELGEYKAEIDEANLVRSLLNGGSATYDNARPPVPWERGANLKWRAELASAAAAAPVASGGNVYLTLVPNTLACYSREDGACVWTYEAKGAKALSAPAVSKDAVFVVDADGNVVKLRLDGTVIWSKQLKGTTGTPVCMIVGGTLVIQAGDLFGVDLMSGDKIWDTASKAKGLPVVTALAGKPALAMADGRFIDSATGRDLLKGLPETGAISPCISKGVVYTVNGGKGAMKALRPTATGASFDELWSSEIGAAAVATPVAMDDKVYVLTEDGIVTVAVADGKVLSRTKLPGKVTEKTALLLGGVHLFVAGLGDGAASAVLKPGAEPKVVWEYDVKGATVPPTFLGAGMYLAGDKVLFAMAGRGPALPDAYTPPPAIPAASDYKPGTGVPVVRFVDNTMPFKWLVTTPIRPMSVKTDYLEEMGGIKAARPEVGQKVKSAKAESEFTWRAFDLMSGDDAKCYFKHPTFSGGFDSVCVRTAADPSLEGNNRVTNSTLYFYTVLNNVKDRYVEPRILTPGGEKWNGTNVFEAVLYLDGVEVAPDQIVKIEKGLIPVLIQTTFTTCNSGGKIWMAPRLTDHSVKYQAEREAYEQAAKVWEIFQKTKDERFVLE